MSVQFVEAPLDFGENNELDTHGQKSNEFMCLRPRGVTPLRPQTPAGGEK